MDLIFDISGVKVLLYERSPRSGGPRSPWAIKKVNKQYSNIQVANRLEKEAEILKSMDHPNIIGYRGFKRSQDGTKILALETNKSCRSLFDVIEEVRDESDDLEAMPAENIIFVAKEVAKGLAYMHNEKKLLHGDLKGANVLIIGDFETVKLCDFGVTIPLDDNLKADPKVQYVGTEPWSAKEVIDEEEITEKADIFALGCIIFEMLSMDTPHAEKLPSLDAAIENDQDASYDSSAYEEAMGTRPELPCDFTYDESYESILSIFYACTSEDPEERPSAKKLVEILENFNKDSETENVPDNKNE